MKKNYFKKSLSVMFSLLLLVFSLSENQAHGMFTAAATTAAAALTAGEALLAAGGIAASTVLLTKGFSDASLRSRIGGSGKTLANNKHFPTRKEAEQAARREGGGPPIHHPDPKDGRGPHFHRCDKSHDHYYYRARRAMANSASSAKKTSYVVQKGDTLSAIAASHGTTVKKLSSINGIPNPNKISAGQVIKIV